MRKGLLLVLVVVALLAASCAQPGGLVPHIPWPGGGPARTVPVPSAAADQPTPTSEPVQAGFPKRSRTFARHFTDPLYTDEGGEFAPFGSDEGWDTLYTWHDRRKELTNCTTIRWMFSQEDEAGALENPTRNGPDVDAFIIATGFALILFTGHIDSEGKQLVLDALHRTYSYYAKYNPREQPVMIRDLESFPATDCPKP